MHPSDPLYAQQWYLAALGGIETIWDEYSGAGVHVGIYDTGVELHHPDLDGNYDDSRKLVFNTNPESGDVNPAGQPDARARGHGTAVAGIIGAEQNGEGAVGIAWEAALTSVNIADTTTSYNFQTGNAVDFATAIRWSIGHFDVTNNSWNTLPIYDPNESVIQPSGWATVNEAFADVSAQGRSGLGTIIVQGIGNDNLDAQGCGLNGSRFTITVAGYGPDGFAANYSNYGACVLVTAPTSPSLVLTAGGVVTTDLTGTDGYNLAPSGTGADDYTDLFGGTSAAGPMVTGVVALMLEASSGLGWRDVQNILAASARHTGSDFGETSGTTENGRWFLNDAARWNGGSMHFSNDYGYGKVDVHDAVRMAEAWSLFTPAQTSANEKPWFNWDDTDQAIPEGGALQTSVNLVPDQTMALEHVDVQLGLTHPDLTQLLIYLVSPAGTEVQLYDRSNGGASVADAFDGGMTWSFGADALRGENPEGIWTVRIEDTGGGETGTLTWFQVGVYGSVVSADDVYHYTDEFLDMWAIVGESGRADLTDANGGTDWIDAAALTGDMALSLVASATTKVNGASWFTIAAGTIENAVSGDGDDMLIGNGAANRLYGMRGNDTLDGAAGADQLHGGRGNDAYVVDDPGDVADESDGAGTDLVKSSISFNLADAAHAKGEIENLTLVGAAKLSAVGNPRANVLIGNGAINVLNGAGGNDTLNANAGNDVLIGGLGRDALTGGTGADRFDFNSIVESVKGASRDLVSGFSHGQHDRIDLSTIDANASRAGNQAFAFIGHDSFVHYHAIHPGVIGMVRFAGGIVQANVNANLAADFEIKASGSALVASDFVL